MATWHIASSGFVTTIRTASGRLGRRRLDDGLHDAGVLRQQVVAAHARLARQAGGDDDHVGPGRLVVVVRPDDPRVVADDRRGLGEVEALALGQALDDVHEDHVGETRLGDALRGGGADVPGADDRDLVPRHFGALLVTYACPRRALDQERRGRKP